jgi:uncharacterized protein
LTDDQQFEHPTGSAEPRVPDSLSQPAPTDAVAGTTEGFPVPVPPRDPVWNGWDVLLLAFFTIVSVIVAEFLTAMAAWVFIYRHQSFRDLVQRPALDLLGEGLGYIPVAACMFFLVEGKYRTPFWKAIKWNWPGRSALKWLGIGVLTVAIDLIGHYLPMPKSSPFEQFFASPGDAYLMAAFAVTVGPLMEELFFRGFLYPVLARWTGVAPAIILTALPFGLLHYLQYRSWSAVLLIILVGVVLGIVREVTKSVGASFLVHIGYNGTLMVLAALATDGFRHMEKAVVVSS